MTKQEWINIQLEELNIFSGILFHNQVFQADNADTEFSYEFDCPEFVKLRESYDLVKIAGRGSEFARGKRLLHYLAPRLHHSSWYDNHVPCNALDLLEYSLDNEKQGINCLNKSKILAECCLALGIWARRVWLMPYSPYDFDNHVVTEIYDRSMRKWIMLDPTTDGYFVDEKRMPLSVAELRDRFANDVFATFVRTTDKLKDLQKSRRKNAYYNAYICKNLFYFAAELENRFGPGERMLTFCPENYSIRRNKLGNAGYRISHMPEEYQDFIALWQKKYQQMEAMDEPVKTELSVMQKAPHTGEII